MFRMDGLQIFSYSPAPCTLSRRAGIQLQLLFNKWRSSFIHRSSLDSTDCEAIRFSRSCDPLLDVLSCRRTPPQSISQVLLDSLQLQADLLVPKQLDSSSDDAGVEIWCRTAECDAGTGAPSNSTSIHVHHRGAWLLCATEIPRGISKIRWIHDRDYHWHRASLQACLQRLHKSSQCASVPLFFGVCVRDVC